MIRRLAIRGLVVIERAEIEPAPGLTAITGETGAGKTVVAQALALLVGAPADARAVRPGAGHALVEATLALPGDFWEGLDDDDPALAARDLVDDPAEVVVARRVPAEGRARALIDGQTATRAAAAAVAGRVVRFSSQHEGRRLVAGATQLAVLDAFAGTGAQERAAALRRERRRLRALDRRLDERARARADAQRRREALLQLLDDVAEVAPEVEEERSLRTERARLLHVDRIAGALDIAVAAVSAEADEPGAVDRVGAAIGALDGVIEVDPTLVDARERLAAAQALLADAASDLRRAAADLDAEPGRLDQIEERLSAYDRLRRRYGPTTADVLAQAAAAREALADLDHGEAADDELAAERDAALAAARALAGELAALRADAAPRLEAAVQAELADLAMGGAEVRVELVAEEADPPLQRVVTWLRANPGLPEAPLADAASGGELSRVLLALQSVAAAAEPGATWIFDEVDAGVGGVTATAVAAKLRALARERQVIVITHLPQVAAVADRHYRLVKGVDDEGRATTRIDAVAGDALVDELCRMLGAEPSDTSARRHAEDLLARRGPERPARRQRKGT